MCDIICYSQDSLGDDKSYVYYVYVYYVYDYCEYVYYVYV